MTGILNALSLANPDSNVIVLTDASPKDIHKKEEVITKATELRNSIHFFLSRDGCGNFTPYLDVARETYGIVVNQIDDFEAFVKFADKVGRFTTALLDASGKRKREASENCINFTASRFTKSIDILFSSISAGSVITVTNPKGSVDKVTSRGTIATYSKLDPVLGKYKVCSTGTFEYSLSAISDLDCFVEYDVSGSRIAFPSPGIYAIINCFIYGS